MQIRLWFQTLTLNLNPNPIRKNKINGYCSDSRYLDLLGYYYV